MISRAAAYYSMAAPPMTYAERILADNPVAYWPMDETSGTTLVDIANGNDLSCSGDITLADPTVRPNGPRSVLFGASSYDCSAGAIPDSLGTACTISLWFRLESLASTVFICGSHGSGESEDDNWSNTVTVGNSGELFLWWESAGAVDNFIRIPEFTIAVDTDYHLFFRKDPVAMTVTAILNGVESAPASYANEFVGGSSGSYFISDSTFRFNGRLHDLAIYDQALPLSVGHAHYAAGL